MKCNLPKMPRSWDRLPEHEKEKISQICTETINAQVDHEEAQLQKKWLRLACIALHRQKDPYGKMRCMAFLKAWKQIYNTCSHYKTEAELDEWLKAEMDAIFGADGYPSEWVDSLENGGKR